MATETEEVQLGRPPKVDDAGVATRERLLAAAAASCVANGFDGATLGDIARRADVSAPAIYNHFGGKVELMMAAGRYALSRLSPTERGVGTFAELRGTCPVNHTMIPSEQSACRLPPR